MSIVSAARLFIISTIYVGLESICLIKLLYPLSVRLIITSKLDYCSSLLYGLPTIYINKLQRVQHAAAKLVTNTPCIYHVTPVLKDLQWLTVENKIEFKIVLLTFKCL